MIVVVGTGYKLHRPCGLPMFLHVTEFQANYRFTIYFTVQTSDGIFLVIISCYYMHLTWTY